LCFCSFLTRLRPSPGLPSFPTDALPIFIGLIDSGITPDHPSLLDVERHVPRVCQSRWATASWLGLWLCRPHRKSPRTTLEYDPPKGFSGICQEGEGFPAGSCNNKIVRARYYIDGFLARHDLDPNEFVSPRDADGHGTHIATIVAGNSTAAHLFGDRKSTRLNSSHVKISYA